MSVLVEFPIEEAHAMLAAREFLVILGFPGGAIGESGFDRLEQATRAETGAGGSEEQQEGARPDPAPNIIFGGAIFEAGKRA